MNNVAKVALASYLKKQAKAIKLAPGIHNLDQIVTLRVKGQVTKGEDYEQTPTGNIPLLLTMALLLEKMGFQRDNAKVLLVEAMQEAMLADEDEDEITANEALAARIKDIQSAMQHVRDVTESLPKQVRSGPTKVEIVVDDVTLAA